MHAQRWRSGRRARLAVTRRGSSTAGFRRLRLSRNPLGDGDGGLDRQTRETHQVSRWRELYRLDRALVPDEPKRSHLCLEVPHHDAAIVAGRGELFHVRVEGQGVHVALVPAKVPLQRWVLREGRHGSVRRSVAVGARSPGGWRKDHPGRRCGGGTIAFQNFNCNATACNPQAAPLRRHSLTPSAQPTPVPQSKRTKRANASRVSRATTGRFRTGKARALECSSRLKQEARPGVGVKSPQ